MVSGWIFRKISRFPQWNWRMKGSFSKWVSNFLVQAFRHQNQIKSSTSQSRRSINSKQTYHENDPSNLENFYARLIVGLGKRKPRVEWWRFMSWMWNCVHLNARATNYSSNFRVLMPLVRGRMQFVMMTQWIVRCKADTSCPSRSSRAARNAI